MELRWVINTAKIDSRHCGQARHCGSAQMFTLYYNENKKQTEWLIFKCPTNESWNAKLKNLKRL